jgi:hypothetical protein
MLVKPVVERLHGERPSRGRSLLAASVAAVGAGVLVYRLLRADGDAEDA